MQLGQRLLPMGVDFDTSSTYIKSDRAFFMKGLEPGWLIKDGIASNAGELKPAESNFLYCSVTLPAGINTVIGYFYYAEANEGYVVVHNSEGYHLIYRIRGIDTTGQIVYRFCRNFKGITNIPKDYFSKGRMEMKSLCRFLPDGTKELYKELYLVNKKVDNLRIVVEDSINTNSFTTPFFTPKNICCGDACRIIKLGVPTPTNQIKITPVPITDTDKLKQNRMFNAMFQFRFKDENAWGQVSEYGLISDTYYNNLASCSKDINIQPNCVWLECNTPCPEIVKRTVCVRSCQITNTLGTDGNLFSDWKEAFTIDLYDKTDANLKWYERKYDTSNDEFQFLNDGKKLRIKFCNNRECKTIPTASVRNENPSPINSGTVASVGKALIFGDNETDLDKFPKEDIKAIKHELIPAVDCKIKYSNVVVWAVVHNYHDNINEPVYRWDNINGFGGFSKPRLINNVRLREDATFAPAGGLTEDNGYNQRFPEGYENFRAILAGTNFRATGVQYQWTPSDLIELGILNKNNADMQAYLKDVAPNKKLLVQKFDFGLVPCGINYFRITDHNDPENLESKSTTYRNNVSWSLYKNSGNPGNGHDKEIFIDTTDGNDYDSMQKDVIAVIQDITRPDGYSQVTMGYFKENQENKIPIELAQVLTTYPIGTIPETYTDHNGFFFCASDGVPFDYKVQLFGSDKCTFGKLLGQTETRTNKGVSIVSDVFATDLFPNYSKDLCNRYFIKGKITECVTGGGISGIAVVLGRTAPVYTSNDGTFKVVAHYNNGRGKDKLIVSLNGNCNIVDCNCNPVNIKIDVNQPSCTNCAEQSVNVGSFSLKTFINKGLPFGYRGQIGLTGQDFLGRRTAIQTDETLFIETPSEQQQGHSGKPLLKIKLPQRFSDYLCQRYTKLIFSISKNLNYEDWVEWAADKVEFVDSAGNVNNINPTKVKIWYRSLNEYNVIRGGNTNTNWKILDDGNNSRVGDIVEFIQNADGIYLPPNVTGNVLYDKQGTYFLVDYDSSFKDLKDGVKFKLKRPYVCETAKTFYEYHFVLNFCEGCQAKDDNGNVVTEFILDYFSSYNLPRQIPVVTDVKEIVNNVEVTTTIKNIKVYPYNFEHHSPSDTWGDHCHNGGRVSYINPYEGKKCNRNQFLLTGSLNQANDGAINYLHYFSLEDEYVIDEQGWGGIIAAIARDDGQVIVICEGTCFSFATNDDRAVVDPQTGYLRLPIKAIFTQPERNPSFNFGCQPADVNTIGRSDSLVWFLDSQKQAFVIHDFSQAFDISQGIQSWLIPNIKKVNSNNAMYWHTCFDYRNQRIYFTKFDISADKFVNEDIDNNVELSETVYYDLKDKVWRQSHFTPEYFGTMFGDKKDCQFFSFKNALPYAHHDAVNPSKVYLNYFGIQCVPVFGVVTNEGGSTEKGFISNEVHCKEILFILERVETSMGQKSKVYEGHWESGGGIKMAPYLCDTENIDPSNSVQDALFDGDSLYGKWLKGLYIPEPGYKGEFFLLTLIISSYFNRDNGGA